MSHITLPRAVGLHIRNSLRGIVNASDDDCGEEKCRECAPVRVVRKALAALDAALAEPDAICSAKDNEAALERVANRVKPGQVKGLLPEPDATREPATDEQVTEAYISPDIDGRWRDFELGFRAAERFHGIGGSKT